MRLCCWRKVEYTKPEACTASHQSWLEKAGVQNATHVSMFGIGLAGNTFFVDGLVKRESLRDSVGSLLVACSDNSSPKPLKSFAEV